MILWDLIEKHIDGSHMPLEVRKIPNGDPLPPDDERAYWVRTMIAKSEDELNQYIPQLIKRKC